MKNIVYHTRLIENNTVKVVGGSFGGALDIETANRLVRSHFTVKVKPSGRCVFVDKQGREVSVYITVDPEDTVAGKAAKAEWLAENRRAHKLQEEQEEEQQSTIESLLEKLTYDEIVSRLK